MSPIDFIRQIRSEFARIEWSSRNNAMITTAMVFAMVGVVSVLLFLLDLFFSNITSFVLALGS